MIGMVHWAALQREEREGQSGMAELDLWKDPWPLDEKQCPCDVHFTRYLAQSGRKGQRIFHFGTGSHHHVGLNAPSGDHAVLGITASEAEYSAYIAQIVGNPHLGRYYKVQFQDIYQTNFALLPQFDIVTLFHVGEFRWEKNIPYSSIDDHGLVDGMAQKLVSGGLLLLYTGSFAYDVAERIIPGVAAERGLIEEPRFESLRVFRKT
jgi:hypothetical protein